VRDLASVGTRVMCKRVTSFQLNFRLFLKNVAKTVTFFTLKGLFLLPTAIKIKVKVKVTP
jgi:hypothetical protein